MHRGCSWREEELGDVAALRLPGVTLAKRTAIGDEASAADLVKIAKETMPLMEAR